jgi:hypothetical protein
MALQLIDGEKSALREALMHPSVQKAMDEALRAVWRKKRGAETLEGAAMAYNHQSGASDFLDELFALAELKMDFQVPMRKLKH